METDVKERVAGVLAGGEPSLVSFDMGSDLDLIWGTGMGCMGRADVLLERIEPDALPSWLVRCAALIEERRTGVLATVFQARGGPPVKPGDRFLREGSLDTLPAPQGLIVHLAEAMDHALRETAPETLTLPFGGGEVDLLVEPILPPIALWVFGAGEHARPLFCLGHELGWYLGLADHRPALATAARFPEADRILVGHPPDVLRGLPLDSRCAALVVSHVFEADKAALGVLLESPLGYLGLQGNRKRSERILRELAEENGPLSDHGRAILHYPAGLDIGAESPEIIALSMVSEVQATLAGRLGSPLRDRPGAIH
jgi:xanthine/CO dehydrogenase XdhC/CoxF family maturation factor